MNDSGYCSHDPSVPCASCRTYYVVPNASYPKTLTAKQLGQILCWLGRAPTTVEEEIELAYVRRNLEMLRLSH